MILVIVYKGLIHPIMYPNSLLPIRWILCSLGGSIYLCTIACLISTPLGVLFSIFVTERKHTRAAKYVSILIRVLQGSSSMVIGLIMYFWLVLPLGTFSALSGGAALAVLMLPITFTCVQSRLEDPFTQALKERMLAMGASYGVGFIKILLPAIFPSLLSAVLLSTSRALGETSALLFTAFGNSSFQLNPLEPIHSLTLLISETCTSPYDQYNQAAWISSFLLIIFILLLHIGSYFFQKKIRSNFL